MFICIECHPKSGCPTQHFSQSVGPCEICGKTNICFDCHYVPPKRYHDYIMKAVRQRLDLEEDDTSKDKEIMEMSKEEVFSEVLIWEGFINYDRKIKSWIKDIYGVELK